MASRWVWLMRGGSRPLVVELTSSTAELCGAAVPMPTLPAPENVSVWLFSGTSVAAARGEPPSFTVVVEPLTVLLRPGPAAAVEPLPAGPCTPWGPAGPIGPATPCGPAGPSAPCGPVGPATPCGPAGPGVVEAGRLKKLDPSSTGAGEGKGCGIVIVRLPS